MASYYWVDSDTRKSVPPTALVGGHDLDGSTIYVGRAYHAGDWIPAKVIPSKNIAYISYRCKEIPVHRYQILCEERLEWVPAYNGGVPPNAVVGGTTADGEKLYIGRAHHNGTLTVGKVHPSHNTCYIAYNGDEVSHKNYEILVLQH